MRILAFLSTALVCLVLGSGPGPMARNDETTRHERRAQLQKEIRELRERMNRLSAELATLLMITEVPRPNSGTYTTEKATKLVQFTMARSRAIDPHLPLVAEWRRPTMQGFRVHITAQGDIQVLDSGTGKKSGLDGLLAAVRWSSDRLLGNPLSVLVTAEIDGWHTATQQQVLDILFRPSIQLYIVTDN